MQEYQRCGRSRLLYQSDVSYSWLLCHCECCQDQIFKVMWGRKGRRDNSRYIVGGCVSGACVCGGIHCE